MAENWPNQPQPHPKIPKSNLFTVQISQEWLHGWTKADRNSISTKSECIAKRKRKGWLNCRKSYKSAYPHEKRLNCRKWRNDEPPPTKTNLAPPNLTPIRTTPNFLKNPTTALLKPLKSPKIPKISLKPHQIQTSRHKPIQNTPNYQYISYKSIICIFLPKLTPTIY